MANDLAIKLDDKVPAHIKLDGVGRGNENVGQNIICLLYTSPSPRD